MGGVKRTVDFDILRQELSNNVVEGLQERYQFTWPDKKRAMLAANAPINKTLRPCREESVDFDNTENLYIEGDNLEVLKLLQETYLGKIKMIYIVILSTNNLGILRIGVSTPFLNEKTNQCGWNVNSGLPKRSWSVDIPSILIYNAG